MTTLDPSPRSATRSSSRSPSPAGAPRAWRTPRVDVLESAADYVVIADVPGVDDGALDVRFEDGQLVLEAPFAAHGAGEAPVAGFRRAFSVPRSVDTQAIEAQLVAGVLEVRLPKVAAAQPRRVPVRSTRPG